MSILREVITSVEEVEWNNLKERIPTLMKAVHSCKMEVYKLLDEYYVEFTQKPVKIPHFADKLLQHEEELKSHISSCEGMMKKEIKYSQKYNDCMTLLVQAEKTLSVCEEVKSCYYIHEKLVDFRLLKNDCENSLQIIDDIGSILCKTKFDILFKYYRYNFTLMKSRAHFQFGETLKKKFNFGMENDSSFSYIKVDKNIDIGNTIKMLLIHFKHIQQLNDLIEFIWEGIIVPVVTYSVQLTSNSTSMKLNIMRKLKPHYEDVFTRLHEVNSFLSNHMNINIDTPEANTLLDYIGNRLKDRVSPLLISKCFKNIERNVAKSGTFSYVNFVKQVENLQLDLKNVKLLSSDSLLEYTADLQQIISKRSHDVFFSKLKKIMSQTHNDIITIGSSDLQHMIISNVVQELHKLTEEILITSKENEFLMDVLFDLLQYFRNYTSSDIHAKTPKEVALVHNNYSYMAHKIGEWNISYSENITQKDEKVPLFKDEQILFQTVGEKILQSFVLEGTNKLERQIQQLEENKNVSAEVFENTLRRNLSTMDSLMNSRYGVLPKSVFNRCHGIHLNVLCGFLIQFLLRFESIEENLCKKITTVFIDVLKVVGKYFVEENLKEVVQCWEQFKVLSLILKSDLVEVEINKYHELLKLNFEKSIVEKVLKAIFKPSRTRDAILLELYD